MYKNIVYTNDVNNMIITCHSRVNSYNCVYTEYNNICYMLQTRAFC